MAAQRIRVAEAQLAPLEPVAHAAVGWLAGFGALLAATVGRGGWDVAFVCGAPALLALGLALSPRRDREQYVLRLVAAALMLPILMVFWGIDEAPGGRLALLFALALLGFMAGTLWIAAAQTRIAPRPGSPVLDAARLGQRVAELARRLQLPARAESARRWRIDLSSLVSEGHAQWLMLDIDATRREVTVLERAGAAGAAPANADEASMRSLGDAAIDATRPTAQRVAYTSAQATPLTPDRLGSVHLELDDERRILRAERPLPGDHKDVIALFALLVTASGHAWQPRLFGARAAAR